GMVCDRCAEGYRPGGFNRKDGGALPLAIPDATQPSGYRKGPNQYTKPLAFGPDYLTNNEVGFKTLFLNRRLQLDGSIYKEDWKNVQTGLFNPGVLGNLTPAVNGAAYQVKGAELQLTWRATEALSLIGSMSYNDATQSDSPCLRDHSNNCITSYYSVVTQAPKQVVNAL